MDENPGLSGGEAEKTRLSAEIAVSEDGPTQVDYVDASNIPDDANHHERNPVSARRKELQAIIQGMKREMKAGSCSKTKKKELAARIKELEAEKEVCLAEGAALAVPQNRLHTPADSQNMDADNAASDLRMPKSKKLTKWQRQELEVEALRQQSSDSPDHRSIEQSQLLKQLDALSLELYDIPPDGHCLFGAISHQLYYHNQIDLDFMELRKLASCYIRSKIVEFLPFYYRDAKQQEQDSLNDSGMASESDDEFVPTIDDLYRHCDLIDTTAEWGGHLEIQALSENLKFPIWIYQANRPVLKIGEQFHQQRPLLLSYHQHAYELGQHYNSVIDKKPASNDKLT